MDGQCLVQGDSLLTLLSFGLDGPVVDGGVHFCKSTIVFEVLFERDLFDEDIFQVL